MKDKKKMRYILMLSGIVALVLIFLLNISLGSVEISFKEIIHTLFGGGEVSKSHEAIITKIRLPRSLASIAGGACLATSGLLLQVFFNNPIVEPYILGISSGSNLFVGLVILGGFRFGMGTINSMGMFLGSFVGAMVIMLLVILASQKVRNITTLLIIGLMIGYICSSITSFLTAIADKESISLFTMWSMGSFAGFTWKNVRILYSIGVPFLLFAFLISKSLNVMLLGEKYAQSMGISLKTFRFLMVFISSVLTAVVTAFAGPVSFIGLAVPHIVRITFKTSDNRIIIPASCVFGGVMAGLCDLGARLILSPTELPLSAMTSIIGAPIVVYLLLRRKEKGL